MKIAIVEPSGKGGMIHYAWQLATAMAAQGAEPILITSRDYELDPLPHTFHVERLLHLWDPKPETNGAMLPRKARRVARGVRWYREWIRLGRHLRALRPDIVQFGDIRFGSDLAALALLRRSGLRLADVCHNVRPFAVAGATAGTFESGALQRRLYARVYRQFAALFVHFERNRLEFESAFPAARPVRTIMHGNEAIFELLRAPDVDGETVRSELGIDARARVVLLFGTLSRYKGIDILIDAFAAVRRRVADAHLVLAGYPVGGWTVDEIRARAAATGIGGALTVVPRYIAADRVAAWMELASAVVFPYDAVFQSGAVHVPLTFGRPVVATDVGAMADVIRDGETGLLVAPRDRRALGSAIAHLLENPERAAAMGRAAAADQNSRFAWSHTAAVILGTYREILGDLR